MIAFYDEEHQFHETGELLPADTPVHIEHFYDGYPLCWDYGQSGAFAGTTVEEEVTCDKCQKHLNG